MESLNRVMSAFFDAKLSGHDGPVSRIDMRASEILPLIWPVLHLFSDRKHVVDAIPYSAECEAEADRALLDLIDSDGFGEWDRRSDAVWRVLYDRLFFLISVATLSMGNEDEIMLTIPNGLSEDEQRQACILYNLLGPARDVPEQYRNKLLQ